MTALKKLLILDDEPDITNILQTYLGAHFDIEVLNNSVKGCQKICENQYDLIVTDLRMPKMDGLDVLAAVRDSNNSAPVIICTGHAVTKNEIAKLISLGAAGILTKPFQSSSYILRFISEAVPALELCLETPLEVIAQPTKPRSLIIDDDANVAEVLSILTETEFENTVITNETEVEKLIRAQKFDLVIADLTLPTIPGVDIIRLVRSVAPDTKIIIATGHSKNDPIVQEALDAGAIDVLEKPFGNFDLIIKKLKQVL